MQPLFHLRKNEGHTIQTENAPLTTKIIFWSPNTFLIPGEKQPTHLLHRLP